MDRILRFDFKRLDVYQEALDFFSWAVEVTAGVPWRFRAVSDQFIDAANSVLGNLGEASGRRGQPGETRKHYIYAQGSTHECAAYLDSLLAIGAVEPEERNRREEQLARIGSMLTKLIRRYQRQRRRG